MTPLPRKFVPALIALFFISTPLFPAHGDEAEEYLLSAMRNIMNDEKMALADFDKAIALKPDYALAYRERGNLKRMMKNDEGALVDFSKAIELDPNDADAHLGRGRIEHLKGDLEASIADITKVLELRPATPGPGPLHAMRARSQYQRHAYAESVEDFKSAIALGGLAIGDEDNARAFIWLARARLGERKAATEELLAWIKARKPVAMDGDWRANILHYLAGQMTAEEFAKSAEVGDENAVNYHKSMVWFYTGMLLLLDGNKSEAGKDFDHCLQCKELSLESQNAKIELKLLREPKAE